MACADIDMNIHSDGEPQRRDRREAPPPPTPVPSVVYCYKPDELVPEKKGPLHKLLQKEPAVLGAFQIMSGLFSIGVGILSAATHRIDFCLFTMFRLSQLTGVLFLGAGVLSNLLFKFPALVTASLAVNCGCIVVGSIAAIMIAVDLSDWSQEKNDFLKMELMELCVLVLEMVFSGILCCLFSKKMS
ncbi:uncharacterized protein si:ch211-269k10.4 [Cololabis saira]|uniref:uncharacterized protein si:ch211-269k10.4 n=1 Tax=Cololabis saira TaxID=129043 RepID=UPI002AD3E92F|nr:uncharacterized protein si:ch211-269k10.4 [Cololabis saira]